MPANDRPGPAWKTSSTCQAVTSGPGLVRNRISWRPPHRPHHYSSSCSSTCTTIERPSSLALRRAVAAPLSSTTTGSMNGTKSTEWASPPSQSGIAFRDVDRMRARPRRAKAGTPRIGHLDRTARTAPVGADPPRSTARVAVVKRDGVPEHASQNTPLRSHAAPPWCRSGADHSLI